MHIHILGICGTFMGGIAAIAQQSGHTVTGCDRQIYPPMSSQLEKLGIALHQGFDADQLKTHRADAYIVGNIMTRGMPVIEKMLNDKMPMQSGPEWLYQHVLHNRRVLAVSGTHGKTTTSSMLAWLLEDNGFAPGYLIGGVPGNFDVSARLGESDVFVIEADEYDTAFFDKRSKFIHYRPDTLILNNLEFDHADIFYSLKDIERQFHHLIKLIPEQGRVLANADDANINKLIDMGCWSSLDWYGTQGRDWRIRSNGLYSFTLDHGGHRHQVECALPGEHNQINLCAAIAAAVNAGVSVADAVASASGFRPPRRRLELKFQNELVRVYDDFAHHPTAISKTTRALKSDQRRLVVVLEPRSNSMRSGVHAEGLKTAFDGPDEIILYTREDLGADFSFLYKHYLKRLTILTSIDKIIERLLKNTVKQSDIVFMSNGGFENIVSRYTDRLRQLT